MTLLIVRHAHAGQRRAWDGDDTTRPLSDLGQRQAKALVNLLAPHQPRTILTSPTVRCRQTVEPLGDKLDVVVEDDDRLFEGAGRSAIQSLLDDVARKRTTVLSSHGDVIPALLHELVERGMTHEKRLVWQKASVWAIEYSKKRGWGAATYFAPPKAG